VRITSDILAQLGNVAKGQGSAGTEIDVPEVLLPTISLSQVPQLATNVVGRTFFDSFINDANLEQTNVAGSNTLHVILTRGFWHITWSANYFRNFAGVDGDRFSLALTLDSGASFVKFSTTDNLTIGEVRDRGEFLVQVSSPNLAIIGFLPTSVGVGNRVKLMASYIGRKLV